MEEIEIKKKTNKLWKIIANVLFVMLLVVCVSVFAFRYVYIETPVIGASMYPTLNNTEHNDTVFINTKKKGTVGDIVVVDSYKAGVSLEQNYIIKRVIAIGLQRVDLRFDGDELVIYIDGERLVEQYETNPARKVSNAYPYIYNAFQSYLSQHSDSIDVNADGLLVPEGCIFVLGDNRQNSTDSASFGPISTESVLGRVDIIVNPGEFKLGKIIISLLDVIF